MSTTTRAKPRRKRMTQAQRHALVDSIRGKYKHVLTSSAKFAAAKRAEIRLEDRRR